jgi:hypothetical protein
MKKMIIAFYLCLLPFACIYSQSEVDSVCRTNIENIFKVHELKIKYDAIQFLYQKMNNKNSFIYIMSKVSWSHYLELISDSPMESKEQQDSISGVNPGELLDVERISEEEMNRYIEQLNCTPEKAHKEYRDLIRDIKFEKELYLKCINAALAKGDLSEYAKDTMTLYSFLPPGQSLIPRPKNLTKLDFLKVFKEFILNDNEEVLPEGLRVCAYLECGCKIQ